MKTFQCEVECPDTNVRKVELQHCLTVAARLVGFLGPGEEFPEGTIIEIHKNEENPLLPTLVALVPEPDARVDEVEALLDGVDLGPAF